MATNGAKPASKNKKRGLPSDAASDTSKRTKGDICPICNSVIKETQQAIFCDGSCKHWMHRQCASLTTEAYIKAGESQQPFYCLHCVVTSQKQDIDILKEQVKTLTVKLDSLLVTPAPATPSTAPNVSNTLTSAPGISYSQPSSLQVNKSSSITQSTDRKFNLVIFGIDESPNGTNRSDRAKFEVDSTVSILTKINANINPTSIRDCFRLGKYKQNPRRPQPILVKLNRAMDVADILSNRSSIDNRNISIKPDLSPQDQQKEALLLKERWSLIQSGVNKSDIKIKSSSLM